MCPQSSAGRAYDRRTTIPPVTMIPTVTASPVDRSALAAELSNDAELVVVSGVPGSGKTTLVSEWARGQRELGLRVEWIDQHSRFADPFALFTTVSNRLGPSRRGGRFEGTIEGVIDNVVGALGREPTRVIVVLDSADQYLTDAHFDVLGRISSRTAAVTFVVIGHSLPIPPAAIKSVTLKSRDLHVSAEELSRFAESAGIVATEHALALTYAAFKGWLTPSLIVLKSLEDSANRQRTHEIAWGLALELAQRYVESAIQVPDANNVLLPLWLWQLSDELTLDTLDVVLDSAPPITVVSMLEDEGAIEPIVGSEPQRWRINLGDTIGQILFGEFDRQHAELRAATHGRFSAWHADQGRPAPALDHAIAAEDWAAADAIMMVDWATLVSTAKDTLRAALNALPDDFIRANPRWLEAKTFVNFLPSAGQSRPTSYRQTTRLNPTNLLDLLASLTGRSATLRFTGEFDAAAELAREAQEILADATPEARAELEPALADLRLQWSIAFLLSGSRSEALRLYAASFDEAILFGNLRIAVEAAGTIALIHAYDGWTEAATTWLGRVPDYADDGTDTVHTNVYLARAMLAVNSLDLDLAERILDTDVDLDRAPEQSSFIAYLQAQISSYRGDASANLARLSMQRSSMGALWSNGVNALLAAFAEVDLLIAGGHAATAMHLLDEKALAPRDRWSRYSIDSTTARAALLSGDVARAAILSAGGVSTATGPARASAGMLLVASIVALAEDDRETARDRFTGCLDIVVAHSLPSVLAGAPFAQLDELFGLVPELDTAEIRRTLAGTTALELPRRNVPKLTDRERQILRQLVDGSTPEEIAAANFVTRGTLKSQLRTLYRKLGTHNRQETILAARNIPGL